jgi:RNA polymerase sigma factor (TIGR02999 family)
MFDDSATDVTTVLGQLHAGDPDAQGRLLARVYDELRSIAASFMHAERRDHTLQPTALVNEFVLRLLGTDLKATDRRSFFSLATVAMRRILAEHGRRRCTSKRGGNWRRVPLDDVAEYFEKQQLDVEAVTAGLNELALRYPRQSEVITLHYLASFTVREIAEQLQVSVSTVESDLRFARAALHRQLAAAQQ